MKTALFVITVIVALGAAAITTQISYVDQAQANTAREDAERRVFVTTTSAIKGCGIGYSNSDTASSEGTKTAIVNSEHKCHTTRP